MLIDAAKTSGVKRFVYMSARGASPEHPVDFFRTKACIEDKLRTSGLDFVILRPSAFMEWHVHKLLGKSLIETGATTIFGSGNNPTNFISARDVAAFAVMALKNSFAGSCTLEIGGPDNPTKREVTDMYLRLSGRTGVVRHIPTALMRVMCPVVRPFNPVLSRLMAMSIWTDTTDQTFDPSKLIRDYPMALTRVEDFISDQIAPRGQA
jgi:NADH dehydrogenase